MKKTPLGSKRKKAFIYLLLFFSIASIAYGLFYFQKLKPEDGKKEELVLQTGDRPLKKEITIYIKADGGLSLRADRDVNSERLELIPNNTKLVVTEELEGWYKVTYNGKEGWISKEYTTIEVPKSDPYKEWLTYNGQDYVIKYLPTWKVQSYTGKGVQENSTLVAFSNQSLPKTLPEGSEFIAPITISVSTSSLAEEKKNFSKISGVKIEKVTVAGSTLDKYTFTSYLSNTQTTSIVGSFSGKTFVFSESGGYLTDLLNMLKTFSIGG